MKTYSRHLVIMAKSPIAGKVKTRLAAGIGVGAATGFFRSQLHRQLLRLGHDPRWQCRLCITPDTALDAPFWPPGVAVTGQGRGDLGQRMQRIFNTAPPGPVVITGSDIPAIRPAHIAAAFKALGDADAVFGPANDGGYWLVGAKRFPKIRQIFGNIRWSGPHALDDTLRNLEKQKIRFLDLLDDIDDAGDYRRWRRTKI